MITEKLQAQETTEKTIPLKFTRITYKTKRKSEIYFTILCTHLVYRHNFQAVVY